MFYSCAGTVASQQPAQLTNSSPSDGCAAPNGMLSNPELAIDEGTISLSSQYSQGYAPIMDPKETFFSYVYWIICIFMFLFLPMLFCCCICSAWNMYSFSVKKNILFLPDNRLLTTLNLALQNSGIDLSQASISVQINLGKRAIKRSAPGSNSTSKVQYSEIKML